MSSVQGFILKRKGIEDFVEVARRMPDVRFIWLGSINKWIIPRKIRRIVEKDHPSNVEFPGYFKGAVFQGAMTDSDAFFFPSYEETEGIVVLEAWPVISTRSCGIFQYTMAGLTIRLLNCAIM